MDNSKLTLTISPIVIEKAKKYAKSKGTSLSFLVESFLKQFSHQVPEEALNEISPNVAKLKGIISLPDDYNYKDELGNLYSK